MCIQHGCLAVEGGFSRDGVQNRPPPQAPTTVHDHNKPELQRRQVSNFLTVFAELGGFAREVTLSVAGIRGSVRV